MTNIKVIGNRVLLEPISKEEKTKGGIYIPDQAQEKPQLAKVIAVGPGTKDKPMTVKIGDQIMHGKYAGTEIELTNTTYLILEEEDILLILGDE